MKAEILSIGSELTSGANLDTNSRWLSQRLGELGVSVAFHTTVGDDFADNVAALRIACERAELVLITGGLGPTQDDLTREVLAEVAGVPLIEDAISLAFIRAIFARRNREMPERNRVQALLPKGAEAIANADGTAPGVWMKIGNTFLAAMPGVPNEMTVMFDSEVKPRLRRIGLSGGVIVERKINWFGAGESAVEEKLFDLTRRGHTPEVGITASDAVISLRIRAIASTTAAAEAIISPVEEAIRKRLGDWVFGVGEEQLEDAAMRLLMVHSRTVATAESITAGLVAHRLASVPGASRHLVGGVVAYTNDVKVHELNVPEPLIVKETAVSEQVAKAMAEGARAKFNTDYGVATTGYAGPDGASVGLIFAAVASECGTRVQRYIWGGIRSEIQNRTAKLALNMLRLAMCEETKSDR